MKNMQSSLKLLKDPNTVHNELTQGAHKELKRLAIQSGDWHEIVIGRSFGISKIDKKHDADLIDGNTNLKYEVKSETISGSKKLSGKGEIGGLSDSIIKRYKQDEEVIITGIDSEKDEYVYILSANSAQLAKWVEENRDEKIRTGKKKIEHSIFSYNHYKDMDITLHYKNETYINNNGNNKIVRDMLKYLKNTEI